MTLQQALDVVNAHIQEVREIRYKVYRMQWPNGHSDDPGPPEGLRDYVETKEAPIQSDPAV